MPNENNSSAPLNTSGDPFFALGECIADQICLSVAELPDRDSPADWPQAMLVTSDELRNIVLNAINYAAQAVAAQAAPAAVADMASMADTWESSASDLAGNRDGAGEDYNQGVADGMRICSGDLRAALAANPAATEESSAGDLADEADDEGISREDWLAQAERLYLTVGDTQDEARMCASYLYNEQDWDGFGGDDPIHAALDDVEGRGPKAAVQAEPVAWTELQRETVTKLLELARIVDRAVEDWGESLADGSSNVIFHKEEADARDAILDFLDSLPENPDPMILESGPLKAARLLSAPQAQPADALERDVRTALQMLQDREWAENFAKSDLGKQLESAITDLHSEIHEAHESDDAEVAPMAAAQEGGNAAKEA